MINVHEKHITTYSYACSDQIANVHALIPCSLAKAGLSPHKET